jgi:hypothetical protein
VVVVDAPKVLWALGFHFDSSNDGTAVKDASRCVKATRLESQVDRLSGTCHQRADK